MNTLMRSCKTVRFKQSLGIHYYETLTQKRTHGREEKTGTRIKTRLAHVSTEGDLFVGVSIKYCDVSLLL